jgi:hypothetical protein
MAAQETLSPECLDAVIPLSKNGKIDSHDAGPSTLRRSNFGFPMR